MAQQPFLTPDVEQIRHQIRGIIDSYSHEWDILSELLQNSIDAIKAKEAGKGHVEVTVDAASRRIVVKDNGVGMDVNEANKLLRPFGTNKVGKTSLVGEKGVGLKFVLFSSANMKVTTVGTSGSCQIRIENAASWLDSESSEPLLMDFDEESKQGQGTEVDVTVQDIEHPIFSYSFEELIFILRTKTAVGNTGHIWQDPLDADTKFVYFDKGGQRQEIEFECRYLLPVESCKKTDCISIDEFNAWLKIADHSDAQKRKKLFNKIVTAQGKVWKSGRDIRYWSCFIPGRDFWKILSENQGIKFITDEATGMPEAMPGCAFSSGFDTSTKGMPTSIRIELKIRGSAGYLPNFFILMDDPSLRFDIGRKSIQGRQQGMLRAIAAEVFREYIRTTQKYMGGSIDNDNPAWNKDQIFAELESLPNLGSPKSRFVKRPNSQEATVAALFYEQLGRGEYKNVTPLLSGYKGRYDLYVKWNNRRIVLEFKYDLAGLLKDFNDEKKMFDEIDVLVVWEITENDRTLAGRRGINVEDIEISSFKPHSSFPGAAKQLYIGGVNPLDVIEIKSLIA